MDTLSISTGEKRIAINGDESRVIVFNPSDVIFAERFYNLMGEFQERLTDYQNRSKAMDDSPNDENGLPANMQARIDLMKEACSYIREKIDVLFGEGTSQKVFGDALELRLFTQFFEGILPFVQTARIEKIVKYTNKKKNGKHPR